MRFPRLLLATATAVLAFGAPASANLLPAQNVTLPIKVPALGGFSVGNSVMTVTYTDSDATATVTAPSVMLGTGQYFRVDTCLKRHLINNSYESKCNEKYYDTRSNAATITVAAPTQSLTSPRPYNSGSSGYFAYTFNVYARQSDGSYKLSATSWPNDVTKASISIPPKGLTAGAKVVGEGAALSSGISGGMNSAAPDSFCGTDNRPAWGTAASDVSTTSLGSGAPAYYEIGEPSGAYAGKAPKGVILVIHGGGWFAVGPHNVEVMRSEADRWRARGWRTLNLTYRACGDSMNDVKWFYDAARSAWGTSLPYCATGQSAGATLALLLAIARPTVSCVAAEAGPTDMTALKTESVDVPDPVQAADGAKTTYNWMAAAFGGDDQAIWWSPSKWTINARVLWGVGAGDQFIPAAQGDILRSSQLAANANAYVDIEHLAGGAVPWVHTSVSQDALNSWYAAEEQLVAPLTA